MNLFDIIPGNFFNLLSSQSNGAVYSGALLTIYEEYEHEISYRISRDRIRDAVAIYLLDKHIHLEESDIQRETEEKTGEGSSTIMGAAAGPESENAPAAGAGDMATVILRKFAMPEVGWITDEIDDTTYSHNIVMTEQGIRLAEFLEQLMKPERAEFSGFIFDIYNRLENEKQWQDNPYINALNAVFHNARSLSHALKQLSTFIRDIIARMVKEESLQSLTENILDYCNGDFIKEYSRLNRQQNIHIYRSVIIRRLQEMEESEEISRSMVRCCMKEEGIGQADAENLIAERFRLTRKFLKDDYDRIMHEIQHKITIYLQIAVGRARFLQNRDSNTRGFVEQSLKYLISQTEKMGMKEKVPDEIQKLFAIETYDFINPSSLRYPGRTRTIRKSEETEYFQMSEEEMAEAMERQKQAAYNPYSKEDMKQYILERMQGETSMTSDRLPMEKEEELLAALSAVAYGHENGFEIRLLDGYQESHNLRLRRFLIRQEGK